MHTIIWKQVRDTCSISVVIMLFRVLTWGAGRFGQLGNNSQNDCATPSDITCYIPPEMGKVVQVSASSAHTAVLTDRGKMLTFGDSRYDQLGTVQHYTL